MAADINRGLIADLIGEDLPYDKDPVCVIVLKMILVESVAEFFPKAKWQRCTVHFYRNVFCHVPRSRMPVVADMLDAPHFAEDLQAAMAKAQ